MIVVIGRGEYSDYSTSTYWTDEPEELRAFLMQFNGQPTRNESGWINPIELALDIKLIRHCTDTEAAYAYVGRCINNDFTYRDKEHWTFDSSWSYPSEEGNMHR